MPQTAITNGYGGTLDVDSHDKPLQQEQNGASHIWLNNPSPSDVKIVEQLLGTKKKMRIMFLGAGVSALDFFKFAEERLENVEIVCYEKNHDVGGTWLENRYPGCACDIPSVVYQFPWRPAPWSAYYSSSPEIWEYVKMVEQENNFIGKYIKLRHKVQKLSWDDETAKWTVFAENLETGRLVEDQCDIVINGGGILNRWKYPDITGLHDFKGILMHSAQYQEGLDLKGKKVALIGAGSSAVQILPNIYKDVAHVYHWIRNKIWITAGFAQAFAGKDGANFQYTEEQRKLFEDKDAYKTYCKMIEGELNQRFSFIINGSPEQKAAREFSENEMKTLLKGRPELLEAIMPTDFFVACRRPTPGNGYLETLTGAKTTTYTTQLERVTERGFVDPAGKEHEVDVIICATGFDTSYNFPVPLLVNGVDKQREWKARQNPPSYLSLAYAGVPNMFVFGGAYCPSAHGSFFPLIDAYVGYVLQVIEKMQVENIRSVKPKMRPTEHFLRHADTFLKRTSWTGPCSSWFKGGTIDGTPAIYPGSRLHFLRMLEKPRYEDFEIQYDDEGDMWSFFGNGFHRCERDNSDITWYLGTPETKVDVDQVRETMSGLKGVPIERA